MSGTRCLPRDHAVATRVLRRPHVYYTCVERTTWLVHAPAEDHVATSSLWKIPPGYYTRVERPTRLLHACEEYHTGRTSLWKNYTATTREWSGSHRYFSCVKGQHEFYTRVEMTPRLLHVCGEDHPATASWDENSIYVCKGYLHTCTDVKHHSATASCGGDYSTTTEAWSGPRGYCKRLERTTGLLHVESTIELLHACGMHCTITARVCRLALALPFSMFL